MISNVALIINNSCCILIDFVLWLHARFQNFSSDRFLIALIHIKSHNYWIDSKYVRRIISIGSLSITTIDTRSMLTTILKPLEREVHHYIAKCLGNNEDTIALHFITKKIGRMAFIVTRNGKIVWKHGLSW